MFFIQTSEVSRLSSPEQERKTVIFDDALETLRPA